MGIRTAVIAAGLSSGLLVSCGDLPGDCPENNNVFGTPTCVQPATGAEEATLTNNSGAISQDFATLLYKDNGTATTADDTIELDGGDFDGDNNYSRQPSLDRGGMLAFVNDFREQNVVYFALVGETPSGAIRVHNVATGDYFEEGDFRAAFERLSGSSSRPTTGNATFTGNYAGTAVNTEGGGVILTSGEIRLNVEFQENGRTQGFIFNRTVLTNTANLAAEAAELSDTIVLNEGTMNSDGIYQDGTTAVFDADGDPAGAGTYVGAIGGPNGSETGGYLETTEQIGATTLREFGVFTADCIAGAGLTCSP